MSLLFLRSVDRRQESEEASTLTSALVFCIACLCYFCAVLIDGKIVRRVAHTEADLKPTRSVPRCYSEDQLDEHLKPYCKVVQRTCVVSSYQLTMEKYGTFKGI